MSFTGNPIAKLCELKTRIMQHTDGHADGPSVAMGIRMHIRPKDN